ncbi:MAG TPA: WXG100 family type VII secretion target [Jatrophihabitans sp.]|nr:WXG100 family type VII secretion target [Jatrophihabitans sp.]
MTRLAADLDQLADLVDRLALFQDQLADVVAEADARARQVEISWRGSAAAAHAAAHARWRRGAAEVHEALAVLRAVVVGARANYEAATAANRRMWAL